MGKDLVVAGITVRFGGIVALDGISFRLGPGSITGVVGPNGAGKTTLLNVLSGLASVASGTALIEPDGIDLLSTEASERLSFGVGRTFQIPVLVGELTVEENVLIGMDSLRLVRDGVWNASRPGNYEESALTGIRRLLKEEFGVLGELGCARASLLSFTYQKMIEVVRAVASNPWLLLVDEATSGLDSSSKAIMAGHLKRAASSGMTILLVDHDASFIRECSQNVLCLREGALAYAGAVDGLGEVC